MKAYGFTQAYTIEKKDLHQLICIVWRNNEARFMSPVELDFRLLSLLLMQTFVALAVSFPEPSSARENPRNTENITGGQSLIKTYQLVSVCSDRRVQMKFKRQIDARGEPKSPFSQLNFVSDSAGSGSIRIVGKIVNQYLCFSRNGRLINRTNGGSLQCMFNELSKENHIKLQSVANPDWYVGFNRRGRKVKGYTKSEKWKKKKCFRFFKTELSFNDPYVVDKSQNKKFVNLEDGTRLKT
uniref:Uncharacterized protein n=1 Tax=Arion vulgaris TaxID=1028688 RepID=A0A0B6ZME6_9EUPU